MHKNKALFTSAATTSAPGTGGRCRRNASTTNGSRSHRTGRRLFLAHSEAASREAGGPTGLATSLKHWQRIRYQIKRLVRVPRDSNKHIFVLDGRLFSIVQGQKVITVIGYSEEANQTLGPIHRQASDVKCLQISPF